MALGLINIDVGTPTQVTREQYTNVGSGANILGDYTRGFFGSTDFEMWTAATGGTQLTEGTDYSLSGIDLDYSTEAGQNVYSTFTVLNPTYQTGSIYITYKTIGTFAEKEIFDDLDTRVTSLESTLGDFRTLKTDSNGGKWFEIIWGSSTTVIIKPKEFGGYSWIGARLNDGTYLEDTSSSSITVTLDATTLDGIGVVQNNSWYWICAYEDSGGNLAFDLMFMPSTTISASNPANDVTLTQLNSNDIRSLYPVGADVCIWESSAKFETPLYDTTGVTYTPASTDMQVASYPAANQIRLSASLTVTNFTSPTAICYLANGFEPIDCTTETIHANIGARGWMDSGIRIRSNGSSQIDEFRILDGNYYSSVLQTVINNITADTTSDVSTSIPADKTFGLSLIQFGDGGVSYTEVQGFNHIGYWSSSKVLIGILRLGGISGIQATECTCDVTHAISRISLSSYSGTLDKYYLKGYKI